MFLRQLLLIVVTLQVLQDIPLIKLDTHSSDGEGHRAEEPVPEAHEALPHPAPAARRSNQVRHAAQEEIADLKQL